VNRKTEGLSLNCLKDFLMSSSIIVPYIEENDKTPVWDGNLFIYNNPPKGNYDHKKADLNSKIPVQVKGKTVKKLHENYTSYSFSLNDLEAYYKDGGVILFFVEIDSNDIYNRRIFYESLLPYDIKKVTNNFTCDSKKNIKLKHLKENDVKKFEDECENFIINREMQYSTKDLNLSLEEAKELIIKGKSRNSQICDYLLQNSVYLYGKKHKNDPIPLIIDKVNLASIEKKVNRNVSINGNVYFKNYKIEKNKESEKLILSDKLKLIFKDNNCKFDYIYHDNFAKRFNSIEFILKIIENGGFLISDKFISLDKAKFDYENIKNDYDNLEKIGALLNIFKIKYSRLNLDEIKNEDAKNLDMLINSMIFNKNISNINNLPGIFKVKIGNINLLIFVYKNNDKVIMKNFGDLKHSIRFKINNIEFKNASPFIILQFEDILNSDNIFPSLISKNVIESDYTRNYSEYVVNLLLNIIKVYDKTKKTSYLNAGLEISEWLKKNDQNNPIHIINEFQIYARKRDLTSVEIDLLKNIIKNNKKHEKYTILLTCIYILLQDFKNFKKIFNKLSTEQKKEVKKYPIYQLYEINKS